MRVLGKFMSEVGIALLERGYASGFGAANALLSTPHQIGFY
jgi:hypothetical protein